ncbi:hypothetical protein MOQ72_37250 [Saccharopolyspora sp. K220]|uniref:hypothetical protein n=1 Tax=Saccharopolyspora soli TaxID=2926618 RepID=UPI001F56A34F|nr:hypothetical protein [Saccharopolyspora soli]MCI2423080.1 hypothetical protein [Saccharopolyspora soli]
MNARTPTISSAPIPVTVPAQDILATGTGHELDLDTAPRPWALGDLAAAVAHLPLGEHTPVTIALHHTDGTTTHAPLRNISMDNATLHLHATT